MRWAAGPIISARLELEIPLGAGARELGLRPSIYLQVGALFGHDQAAADGDFPVARRCRRPGKTVQILCSLRPEYSNDNRRTTVTRAGTTASTASCTTCAVGYSGRFGVHCNVRGHRQHRATIRPSQPFKEQFLGDSAEAAPFGRHRRQLEFAVRAASHRPRQCAAHATGRRHQTHHIQRRDTILMNNFSRVPAGGRGRRARGLIAQRRRPARRAVAVLDPDAAIGKSKALDDRRRGRSRRPTRRSSTRRRPASTALQPRSGPLLRPLDTNKDGQISQQEAQAAQTAKSGGASSAAGQAAVGSGGTAAPDQLPFSRAQAYAIEQITPSSEDEAVQNVVKQRRITVLLVTDATFVRRSVGRPDAAPSPPSSIALGASAVSIDAAGQLAARPAAGASAGAAPRRLPQRSSRPRPVSDGDDRAAIAASARSISGGSWRRCRIATRCCWSTASRSSILDRSITAIKAVTINEGFFQGHFPGRPIMPGVLIVEALAQAAGVLAVEIARARRLGQARLFHGDRRREVPQAGRTGRAAAARGRVRPEARRASASSPAAR